MEFLKKITTIIILSGALNLSAQSFNEKLNAFKESYIQESKQNYKEAIASIIGQNNGKCYECELRLGWLNYMAANHTESIKHYQIAAKLMPASTEALWGKVNPLTATENWSGLAETYKSILLIDPKNSVANYRLGLYYYYQKDYVKSHKYFEIALNIAPFDYNSMLMDAWSLYFLGNKNDAKLLFQKVLLYNTEDTSAMEGLGLVK